MQPVLADGRRPRPRHAAISQLSLSSLVLALSGAACRAPGQEPLAPDDLSAAVEARAASEDDLARALSLAALEPLSIPAPDATALGNPEGAAFWHACALVWSPSVRAARSALLAARARAGSAGAPGPLQGVVEIEDLGDPSQHTRVMPTLDLSGVLGLEPSAAARALADAEARAALCALEQAVWSARYEVDAARARLAAIRTARESLRTLRAEADEDRTRIDVLEANGRLDGGALAVARLAERKLAGLDSALVLEEARVAEALALAAGLPPSSPALAAPDERTLGALLEAPSAPPPSAEELLTRLPVLRTELLEYAVAEARLRTAAAARWPGLRLGPHLKWTDGDFLFGALAAAEIPWPGALDGEIEAARVERTAARERVEDALLAARARLDGALARRAAASELLERDARPAAAESERLWRAARAQFSVEPAALSHWAEALRMRAEALAALEEARGVLALTALAAAEAAGPVPASREEAEARP